LEISVRNFLPRWAAVSAASAVTLVAILPLSASAQTMPISTYPQCQFNAGFAALTQALPQNLVG
jgi:hypothetical protein